MNELKPEDVMRALECCATAPMYACNRRDCPYYYATSKYSECKHKLLSDVASLLREKDAEIERLQVAVEQYEEERKYHFEMSRKRIAEAIDEFADGCVAMAIGIYGVPVVWLESILKFAEKMKGEIYGNKQGKTSKP